MFSTAKYDNAGRAGGAATQTDSAGNCCEGGASVTPGRDLRAWLLACTRFYCQKTRHEITRQILSPQPLLQKLQIPLLLLTDNGVRRDDM